MNCCDLLNAYRQSGSEHAFAELVRRFAGLVYSGAKRKVQNSQLAEDVTQSVFTRLAKAAPRLSSDGELVAWLHRTTIHVAIDTWRSEIRRRMREQKAAAMNTVGVDELEQWQEIAPHLDEAIDQLSDTDRQAVLLRFFHQKPMREVGQALGVSEDAAKMRVGRAVDRLRTSLVAKGATCSTAVLGSLILRNAVEAVPPALMAKLSSILVLAPTTALSIATLPFVLRSLLMSNTKTLTGIVLIGAFGIGVLVHNLSQRGRSRQNVTADSEPSRLLFQRPIDPNVRTRSALAAQANGAAALNNLKDQLRAMLQTPSEAGSYPPPALRDVLSRFGDQVLEAVPILLESLAVEDHVTRCWAMGGLHFIITTYRESEWRELSQQAFAQARPALARILQSGAEPVLLRHFALGMYVPHIVRDRNGTVLTRAELYLGAEADLIAALKVRDKQGFRGTMVDMLNQYFAAKPGEASPFRQAVQPMLEDANQDERALAAYALATWPDDKPPELKRELVRELQERSKHSYRAAQALGRLGPEAADTVPALLAYAEATKGWSAGYATSALESACRLQPELRTNYPEIDKKLRQEEATLKPTFARPQTLSDWVASLPQDDDARFTEALARSIHAGHHGESPVEAKQAMLTSLEAELGRAPEEQRAALRKAINLAQEIPTDVEPSVRRVLFGNLTLDARVLLVENENPNSARIEGVLRHFDEGLVPRKETVTAENYSELAQALREIDPQFEAHWRKTVLLNYPELDRVLPKEKP